MTKTVTDERDVDAAAREVHVPEVVEGAVAGHLVVPAQRRRIHIMQMTRSDFESILASASDQGTALGFFTLCLGSLLGLVASAVLVEEWRPVPAAFYSGAGTALTIATLVTGQRYLRSRSETARRRAMLEDDGSTGGRP